MVPVNAPSKADNGGLNQICQWGVNEGEVAVWHLPQREADAAVECIAQIPQNDKMRILPKHNGRCGQKQPCRCDPVAQSPAAFLRHSFELVFQSFEHGLRAFRIRFPIGLAEQSEAVHHPAQASFYPPDFTGSVRGIIEEPLRSGGWPKAVRSSR